MAVMGAKVDSLEVEARAERREEHPTLLSSGGAPN